MIQRRHEIEVFASTCGEPAKALLNSALRCQDKGDLDAAARIASDQVAKRPRLKWVALLLALEATELRLGGAVKIATPVQHYDGTSSAGYFEERWDAFKLTTYPEEVQVDLELTTTKAGYLLRSRIAKDAATYDPLVKEAVRCLAVELSAHLHAAIGLERS